MINALQSLPIPLLLLIATTLEVTGDALVRMSIYQHTGALRVASLLSGAALLLGYGFFLNTAPVEFGRIVGLYIATLFVVWQIVNYITFKTVPPLPVIVGGIFIVSGGLIVTFWKSSP